MEIQVTQEQVDAMLRQIIEEKVNNLDVRYDEYGDYVGGYSVAERAEELIKKIVKKRVDEILEDKVEEIAKGIADDFLAMPVDIYDGWGERSHFDSYADMFAHHIRKQCGSEYDLKRTLNNYAKERVEKAWDEYKGEVIPMLMEKMKEAIDE